MRGASSLSEARLLRVDPLARLHFDPAQHGIVGEDGIGHVLAVLLPHPLAEGVCFGLCVKVAPEVGELPRESKTDISSEAHSQHVEIG